jgi:uncharacterized membrane protein YhaH (DUF805 family)
VDWYIGVLKKYATFGGRARRTEYWMFVLFNVVISFGLGFLDGVLGLTNNQGNGPLGSIYSLAVLLPSLAVGIRRMHDTDHSGWWIIVPIMNLVYAVSPGTLGPNRFGADPKAGVLGAPAVTPAGWYPDPTGRHQHRYWDSTKWTSSVSDNGVTAEDPA